MIAQRAVLGLIGLYQKATAERPTPCRYVPTCSHYTAEAVDLLQAMNTGHEGSMTTTHANSPTEATTRLETLCLMAGLDLPSRAIRDQIASSVHLVVQQTRFSDGSRRVTAITELVGVDEDGEFELQDIFAYHRTGTGPKGKVEGEFRASGYLPSFLDEFITHGLVSGKGGVYL